MYISISSFTYQISKRRDHKYVSDHVFEYENFELVHSMLCLLSGHIIEQYFTNAHVIPLHYIYDAKLKNELVLAINNQKS